MLNHLAAEGTWAKQNDDKYGPDIVVWQGFQPRSYIEVETRSAWRSGAWPASWQEVHIPERKLHLFQLALPCEHWIISADLSSALIIPDYVMKEFGVLKEFSNSKIQKGENFLHVPAEECIQKELKK